MLVGLFVDGLSTTQRLLSLGVGAAGRLRRRRDAREDARAAARARARLAGERKIGGAAGELARGNAMRNPQRTASTASALMIGLALVTLVSVLAAGLKTTFENAVDSVFKGDYALTATDNFSPISIASEQALAQVPGVKVVSGVRAGDGKAFGGRINVTGVPGDIAKVIVVNWEHGSQAVPAQLGENGAFVDKAYAKAQHLSSARRSRSRCRPARRCTSRSRASSRRRRAARRSATSRSRSSASTRSTRTRRTSSPSSTWPAASPPRTRRR